MRTNLAMRMLVMTAGAVLAGAAMAQPAWVCDAFPRSSGNADEHVAVAPDGAAWYGDMASNRLMRVAPDRSITAVVPVDAGTARISGLTIGPDGALWYSKDGGFVGRLPLDGGTGTEYALPERHNFPLDLARGPDGHLWYHDPVKQGVGRVSTSGALTRLMPPAFGGRPFMSRGLAVGSDGGIWVTDTGRNAVHRVDPASGQFSRFDIPSPGAQPKDIVAAADGNLWFTMPAVRKLGRITPQGVITEYALPDTPLRLLPAQDGMLWISFTGNGTLGRFDTAAGRMVETFPCGFNATRLFFGPGGQVWALANTRIMVVRPRLQPVAMPVAASAPAPKPAPVPAAAPSARAPWRGVLETQVQGLLNSLKDVPGRVLVQFTSRENGCTYCVRGNPTFDQLAEQRRDDARVSFVRVLYQPWTAVGDSALARDLGILGLPAVVSFEGGRKLKLHQGSASADKLDAELLADLPMR